MSTRCCWPPERVATLSPARSVRPTVAMARSTASRSAARGRRSPVSASRPVATTSRTVAGTPVHLTGKEYAILELLVLRKGMVLTKEAFLNHLYGGMDEPEVKIIDVFICKLRKKLSQAGADNLIGTVWGRGYMLRDPSAAPAAAASPKRPLLLAQAA